MKIGGTEIGSNTWAIQRNQTIYGEDSELFRPERWLEGSDETLQKMERTLGVVFGSGKYVCLGKNIAMMELDKIFFEVSSLYVGIEIYLGANDYVSF